MLEVGDAKPLTRTDDEDVKVIEVAGWRVLARIPGATKFRPAFLRAYKKSVERDEARLQDLVKAAPVVALVQNRVGRAIRTVAAFDPWYLLRRRVDKIGREIGLFSAIAAVFALAAWRRFDLTWGALEVFAALAVIIMLRLVDPFYASGRDRALYSAALFVAVVALDPLLGGARPELATVFLGVETFLGIQSLFAIAAYTIFTVTTWIKTSRYPEHEVVQSLLAAWARSQSPESFRRARERVRMVADLEWVALRMERDFVARFRLGDPVTDAWFRQRGAECAAAIRMREKDVAFPFVAVPLSTARFIEKCLIAAALSSWGSFPRADATSPPPRKRLIDFARVAAAILVPAIAAIALSVGTHAFGGNSELTDKLLYIGLGFSFLSLLANIDPQRFDAQVGAARALGESTKR